jgi:hypothetical protein
VSTQTLHYWLIQSDEKIERPDLAAVSVTRDLEIDAGPHCVRDLLGLMREQKDRQCRVGSRECGLEIRAVSADTRRLGSGVIHPRDDEPVTIAFDGDVPIM